MNFTHLVDGSAEPNQELLQRFQWFIVVVVLSEEMAEFALEKSSSVLRRSDAAICWVVTHKHFRTAALGSTLRDIYELLKTAGNDRECSFVAVASRDELVSGNGGRYIPLHLGYINDVDERTLRLKQIISVALSSVNKPDRSDPRGAINLIGSLASAASLIKSFIIPG